MFKLRSPENILKHRVFIGFQDAFFERSPGGRKFVNLDVISLGDFESLNDLQYEELYSFAVEYTGASKVFAADNEWYRFELIRPTRRSNARIIPLLPGGYGEPIPVFLRRAESIPVPRSASALANSNRHPKQRFDLASIATNRLVEPSGHGYMKLAETIVGTGKCRTTVVVHDVGQASCASVSRRPLDGELLFYLSATFNGGERSFEHVMLDCGFPLYFNWERDERREYAVASEPVSRTLIVLSHWDMDHYELGRRNINRENVWIAPIQSVGPTSWKIARWLAARHQIAFVDQLFQLHLSSFSLWRGSGSTRLNDSGIWVALSGNGSGFLYSGDCPLNNVHLTQAPKFSPATTMHLAIPHHGSDPWQAPFHCSAGTAVISSGRRNRYGHPSSHAEQTYRSAGFKIKDTQRTGRDITISL